MIERTPYARKREQYYQQNPYSYGDGSDQLANAGSNILDGNRPQQYMKSLGNMYGNKTEEEMIREKQTKQNYARELEQQMKEVQERKRREKAEQEEYERKLDESIRNYNPYGKEGGGAPLRDENGNLRANLAIRSPSKSPPKSQFYSTLRRNEESPPNYLPHDIPNSNNYYNVHQSSEQPQQQQIQPPPPPPSQVQPLVMNRLVPSTAPTVYSRQPLLPSYYNGGGGSVGNGIIPYSQHAIMLYQKQQANRMINYQLHSEIQELRSEFTLEHDSIKHEIEQQNDLINKIQRDLEELQRERDKEKVKTFVLPSVKPSPSHHQQQQPQEQQQHSLFSYPEIPSINTSSNNNNNNPLIVQLKPPRLPHSIFDNPYSSSIIQQQSRRYVEACTSPAFKLTSSHTSPIPFNNNNNNKINLLSPPNTYQLQQDFQTQQQQQQQQGRKPIVPYHLLSPTLGLSSSSTPSNSNSLTPSPLPNKTTFESIIDSKRESPILYPLQLEPAIGIDIDNNNNNNNNANNPVPPPFPEMLPSSRVIDTIPIITPSNNNNNVENNNENSKRFPKLSVRTELDESQSLETTSKYCVLEKREKKEEAIISPSSADGYNNNAENVKRDYTNKSNNEISISEIPASSTEVGNDAEDALHEFVEKKGKWDILDANLSTETK